jgi:hypothetical protein
VLQACVVSRVVAKLAVTELATREVADEGPRFIAAIHIVALDQLWQALQGVHPPTNPELPLLFSTAKLPCKLKGSMLILAAWRNGQGDQVRRIRRN